MIKNIVYLVRSGSGDYDLLSRMPKLDQWEVYYGYDLHISYLKSLCSRDIKKYFGLKRHLKCASKTVLKFELTLKEVKM